MSYYKIPDPEELIPCPYDKVHMVAAKRMQYHLMKCRKNFTGREFATCPFNARHEMPKPELRYHIANCPDKAMLEPILSYEQSKNQEEGKNFKGCTDLPKYDENSISRTSENWDEEIPENPRIGVDPAYFARMEYKDLTGMTRSEKKSWKKQFSLPPEERQFPVQESKEEEEEGQLRKPRVMPTKYMQAQPIQQSSQVLSYSLAMAGIGRGAGLGLEFKNQQGIGRAMGNPENFSSVDRAIGRTDGLPVVGHGIGRAESLPGVGRGVGRAESLPGVGRGIGRSSVLNNYIPSIAINGGLSNGTIHTVDKNGVEQPSPRNGTLHTEGGNSLGPPPGINGQFTDIDSDGDYENVITKAETAPLQAAGIGRGRGMPPSATFSMGIGRGMLRGVDLNSAPTFVIPIVKNATTEEYNDPVKKEGSITAELSVDAKNRERKKIEKKLKQIELLEEKGSEGYKYNSEEVLKIQAKDKLLKALQELQL